MYIWEAIATYLDIPDLSTILSTTLQYIPNLQDGADLWFPGPGPIFFLTSSHQPTAMC